jgi:hypothetical protein
MFVGKFAPQSENGVEMRPSLSGDVPGGGHCGAQTLRSWLVEDRRFALSIGQAYTHSRTRTHSLLASIPRTRISDPSWREKPACCV